MGVSMENYQWAALVPEFLVSDIQKSLDFWCNILGFRVVFDRMDSNFAYLDYGPAQIMLDQRHGHWETGVLDRPFGRGINCQIETNELDAIKARLRAQDWPIYEEREKWYQTGDEKSFCREILVQDPDGYLIRFIMVEITKQE